MSGKLCNFMFVFYVKMLLNNCKSMLMVLYRSSQEGVIFKKRQNHHYVRSLPTCLIFNFITSLSHPWMCVEKVDIYSEIFIFGWNLYTVLFIFISQVLLFQSNQHDKRTVLQLYICICSFPCLFDALCSKYIFLFAIFSLIKLGLFSPILILY